MSIDFDTRDVAGCGIDRFAVRGELRGMRDKWSVLGAIYLLQVTPGNGPSAV